MTVSYRTTMADTWHYASYLSTKTMPGKFLLAFVSVALVASSVASYHATVLHHTVPSHHAASSANFNHLLALRFVLTAVFTYVMFLFWVLIVLYVGTLMAPIATITVDPEFWRLKTFTTVRSRWKQISTVAEEPAYFVGWTRAFSVPKRAFDSSVEAYAFFDLASDYWRKAKGITPAPPPNTSGVWPPAPTLE